MSRSSDLCIVSSNFPSSRSSREVGLAAASAGGSPLITRAGGRQEALPVVMALARVAGTAATLNPGTSPSAMISFFPAGCIPARAARDKGERQCTDSCCGAQPHAR